MNSETIEILSSLKIALNQQGTLFRETNDPLKRRQILHDCFNAIIQKDPQSTLLLNLQDVFNYYIDYRKAGIDELMNLLKGINNNVATSNNDAFDSKFSTITGVEFEQYELPERVPAERVIQSSRYDPSPVGAIMHLLHALPDLGVTYSNYNFIDIGSGLGRNLLLAAQFPFRSVIGVEISEYLHNLCLKNIEIFSRSQSVVTTIKACHSDALFYDYPNENSIYYFWEPFRSREVEEKFLRKLFQVHWNSANKCILVFLMDTMSQVSSSRKFTLLDSFPCDDVVGGQQCKFSIYSLDVNRIDNPDSEIMKYLKF